MSAKQHEQDIEESFARLEETLQEESDGEEPVEAKVVRHTVTLGGTFNIGNFSNVTLKIETTVEYPSLRACPDTITVPTRAIIDAQQEVIGTVLMDILTDLTAADEAAINALIPSHISRVVGSNPLAQWVLEATIRRN